MQSSRKLWSSVLGVVAATLFASSAVRAVEPDKLTPPDAEAVVVVNVRQTLDSSLVKTYALEMLKDQTKGNDQVTKVMEAAGIDPFKDIDSLMFANKGTTPKNEWLAVLHGRFKEKKFHAAANDYAKKNPKELKITGEGKDRVYQIIEADNIVYAALVNDDTLVMANGNDYLKSSLKAGTDSKLNKDMKAALDKVKGGKESIWMALVVTEETRKSLADNPQTADIAQKLDSVTGSLNVADDIQLSVVINTTDANAAQKVAKKIDALKPLLGLLAGGNDQVKGLVGLLTENLQVKSTDKAATLDLKLTEAQLKKALSPDKDK